MPKFEVVSRFKNSQIDLLPKRATVGSAGYDFVVAEDTVIPNYAVLMKYIDPYGEGEMFSFHPKADHLKVFSLEEIEKKTKETKSKPTLVSTGIKAQLDKGTFLQLALRSSLPLKSWLVMGNSVGIIDSDYYNNPSNEGEIFFQLINLSPFPILLKAGDKIGQGIILPYYMIDSDSITDKRVGGFGSTS